MLRSDRKTLCGVAKNLRLWVLPQPDKHGCSFSSVNNTKLFRPSPLLIFVHGYIYALTYLHRSLHYGLSQLLDTRFHHRENGHSPSSEIALSEPSINSRNFILQTWLAEVEKSVTGGFIRLRHRAGTACSRLSSTAPSQPSDFLSSHSQKAA